jgi:UDP-glucuronate 4-epimerase
MTGPLPKHILITGAAGFIGFHTSIKLQKEGCVVIGIDNFNDYYDPSLKRARAKELEKAHIPIIEGDLCQNELLTEIISKYSITHIVHLAAQAGVRFSLEQPQAYIKTNIEGFLNVLESCRQYPAIPLIYASSSSVYGLNHKVPFSTKDRTDNQASLYGVTKKANELMANTYNHLFNITAVGLRFFTVYGPWGRPDMAYFSFTKAIAEGKPIPVFNYGKMQRDFTYIDDIVSGIAAAIDYTKENLGTHEIFNLGNHRSEPLSLFIEIIEQAVGKKAVKRLLPMQAADVEITYADIQQSQDKLGFKPITSLSQGIPKFVKWFKEYYLCKQ